MSASPSIDVVIPLYNCERFIERAITSALAQQYKPRKIIVVDDGSTDRSAAIVRCMVEKNKNNLDLLCKQNGGLSSARNAGIGRSQSDWIAFLDSDDEWTSQKLARQVEVLQASKYPNLGLVYCGYEFIDENGTRINMFVTKPQLRGMVFKQLLQGNHVSGSGSGVLVRRECFEKVGMFDEQLGAAEDWDMWLRISRFFCLDFCVETTVRIRWHAGNIQKNKQHMLANELRFLEKWAVLAREDFPWAQKAIRKHVARLAIGSLDESGIEAILERISSAVAKNLFAWSFGSARVYIGLRIWGPFFSGVAKDVGRRFTTLWKRLRLLARK